MIKTIFKVLLVGVLAALALIACKPPAPDELSGRLVFERKVDGNADVYVMAVDGSGLTRLTDSPGWDGEPSWSPDGSQIVFASDRAGGPAIYVMNADGSNQRALTDPSTASLTPSWSPDGQRIAYASTGPNAPGEQAVDTGFEIWVMNADGSNPQRLAGDPTGQALYPSWGPKSDRLAYALQTEKKGFCSSKCFKMAQPPDRSAMRWRDVRTRRTGHRVATVSYSRSNNRALSRFGKPNRTAAIRFGWAKQEPAEASRPGRPTANISSLCRIKTARRRW